MKTKLFQAFEGFSPRMLMTPVILVSALGYFVDTFDIVLFSLTRMASLAELGLTGPALTDTGIFLLNIQLTGMLLGGLMWGYVGDKIGRSAALLCSILLYSAANLANGFVDSVETYAICRFLSGVGLAGELAAAVTLVMEEMPKKYRGLGGVVITALGALGAVTAAYLSDFLYWRHMYILGGVMGVALLFARSRVRDSKMFIAARQTTVTRADVFLFFRRKDLAKKLVACLMVGVPHYFFLGIMLALLPEISTALGTATPLPVSTAMMIYILSLSAGDISTTLLSQALQSRKRAIGLFFGITVFLLTVFYIWQPDGAVAIYTFIALFGFFSGYFMLTPIITAEMFGTNLRVTATSLVTNLIRASAIVMNTGIAAFKVFGILTAFFTVCAIVMTLTCIAIVSLRETFHQSMEFFDE